MDAPSGAGNASLSGAPEFTQGFEWGSCYSIFSCMWMFCKWLFVLFSFFFWPLCCLFFFDLWILITPLVSSNSSLIIPKQLFHHNLTKDLVGVWFLTKRQLLRMKTLITMAHNNVHVYEAVLIRNVFTNLEAILLLDI